MTPLVLIILDGFGVREETKANAIKLAAMPNYNHFLKEYSHTTLEASGLAVGLPAGVMGNSDVGHLTIGSGRINYQDLPKINKAIDDGSFFENPALTAAFLKAKETGSAVHLMGLLSDGAVHSHEKHVFALVKMAKKLGVTSLVVHCFLDGRDTHPKSSRKYVSGLIEELKGVGEIGTLVGRYYAMDRDQRWERIQMAYEALVEGKGLTYDHNDPVRAIDEAYEENLTDEFIKPIIFSAPRISDGDSVIFFNFRPDRAREITQALTDPNFKGFVRGKFPKLGSFVCLTEYDKTFKLPVAFTKDEPKRILAEILSENGIAQFRIAETEKYAHVTYFFNGRIETPFPGEERLLIPSPKDVATYDQKPEMSARAVTEAALEKIRAGCPVIIMNYANPDMVGHTGVLPATIESVQVIDECLGKIAQEVLSRHGAVLITADHGNCEEMEDAHGGPLTAHTTNPVPFVLISEKKPTLRSGGGLQDVAPTILQLLNLPQPVEMTGRKLIV